MVAFLCCLLQGTLPPELGDANFKELDFHTNYFEARPAPASCPGLLSARAEVPAEGLHEARCMCIFPQGTIPEEWCGLLDREDSRLDLLDPGNNQHLCGKVPSCFYNTTRINPNRLLGSCLIYEDAGSREHPGGPCDSTPPVCGAEGGCILLPSITNRLDYFQFTILGFSDPESGIREYR